MPETSQETSEKSQPEEEDYVKRIKWHPLKIEPKILVITGDKPTATFKVENRGEYNLFFCIRTVPKWFELSFEKMKKDDVDPEMEKFLGTMLGHNEIVEVRVRLKDRNVKDMTFAIFDMSSFPLGKRWIAGTWDEVMVVYRAKETDRWTVEETEEEVEKRKKEDEARWIRENEVVKKMTPEGIQEILDRIAEKEKPAKKPAIKAPDAVVEKKMEKKKKKCTIL